jgi:hypothetical protein
MQTIVAASQGYARDVPMLPPHPDCASLRGCGAGYLVLLAEHCDKAAPWQHAWRDSVETRAMPSQLLGSPVSVRLRPRCPSVRAPGTRIDIA